MYVRLGNRLRLAFANHWGRWDRALEFLDELLPLLLSCIGVPQALNVCGRFAKIGKVMLEAEANDIDFTRLLGSHAVLHKLAVRDFF